MATIMTMIFRKNKKVIAPPIDISDVSYVAEHAIDSRLDGLRFKVLNKSEFEAEKEVQPHSINQISFVRVFDDEGVFSYFELYKGDILILPKILGRFGKVVRINEDVDNRQRYTSASLPITLPDGATIKGTAVGFISDSGYGTFLYPSTDNRILLGACNRDITTAMSKLVVPVRHGQVVSNIIFEVLPMSWSKSYSGSPYRGDIYNNVMLRINGTYYYVGARENPVSTFWAGDILTNSITGSLPGYFKEANVGSSLNVHRFGLYLKMPNIHNHNIDPNDERFAVSLGLYYGRGTSFVYFDLKETSDPYHRLGLEYDLSDGSYLGTPIFDSCFIPEALNYEDFLDIASIICTPTQDTQGNEVDI